MRIGRKSPISTHETLSVEAPKKPKTIIKKLELLVGGGAVVVGSFAPNIVSANSDIEISNDTEAVTNPPLPAGTISDFFLEPEKVSYVTLTLDQADGEGYAQLLPGELGQTSNVNAFPGRTIAASAFVQPSPVIGKAQVFNQVRSNVIVDQAGTFSDGSVEIVDPKRKFDSRTMGGKLTPGSIRVISGFEPLTTVAVNITTTGTECDGYIQLMDRADGPIGQYSNANAIKGRSIAKIGIVMTDKFGQIFVFSSCETDLVIDHQANLSAVDDIVDERAVDTRRPGSEKLSAGSVLEVKGRPNSAAFVSILTVNTEARGYVQALPVNNPIIGSSSNLNMEPGSVVGGVAVLEFDENGIGRIYFQSATDAVVDIQVYLDSGSYTPSSERLFDSRDGTQNRPVVPTCEKIALAVGATATGRPEDVRYEVKVINEDGTFTSYPAPDLRLSTPTSHYAIDPRTCNRPGGPSVYYASGTYPNAEIFVRNLASGTVSKVPSPPGYFDRPDPQAEGVIAMRTSDGVSGIFLGDVTNLNTGEKIHGASVLDYSISDDGRTKVTLESYFAGFFGGDNKNYNGIDLQVYNSTTKRFDLRYFSIESPNTNNRIIDIETSPGGETIAVLRNSNSPIPEMAVMSYGVGSAPSFRRVDLPINYQPLGFKLIDADTAIVEVLDNGPGGPRLRTISLNIDNGSFVVIETGPTGNPVDVAI